MSGGSGAVSKITMGGAGGARAMGEPLRRGGVESRAAGCAPLGWRTGFSLDSFRLRASWAAGRLGLAGLLGLLGYFLAVARRRFAPAFAILAATPAAARFAACVATVGAVALRGRCEECERGRKTTSSLLFAGTGT